MAGRGGGLRGRPRRRKQLPHLGKFGAVEVGEANELRRREHGEEEEGGVIVRKCRWFK